MTSAKERATDGGNPSHTRPAGFGRFWFGAAYYPEHWTQRERATDGERMAAASFDVVRMGEFAWDLMEPSEGVYDFHLFDETIARLGEKGISTILCTPTATPPRWLTAKHPDTLRVDADSRELRHGSRQHCCYASETLRRCSRAITKAMASHYAANANVVGWQTDNEFNCEFSECHCQNCQQGFQAFLRAKYGSIDGLNKAWGTQFWSQTVRDWNEILTPVPGRPTSVNPSQQLDYFRYISASVTAFQRDQVEILRAARPEWFVFTNGVMGHMDYRGDFGRDLDVLGYDTYPMFSRDSARRPASHAFGLDSTRAWSGNFIVPEQQSGPGGAPPYILSTPEPGEMRQMAMRSVARGADSLMFFRWRTCRFGAEEYWCGILDHDNVPRRRYEEAAALGKELRAVGPAIMGTSVRVDAAVASSDMVATDSHRTYSLGLPSPDEVAQAVHAELYMRGYAVGCVHPSDDLSGVRLYIIPHWAVFDPEWVPNLEAFVRRGGTLVIGARTATRNLDNQVVAEPLPGVLRKLAGVTVEEYGRQNDPGNRRLSLCRGGKSIPTSVWYEVLRCEGAQPIFRWRGRHLTGLPAVTMNKIGKGAVIYVGTYFEEQVTKALAPVLTRMSGLTLLWPAAPKSVEVMLREGRGKKVWFFINGRDSRARVSKTPAGMDLVTGRRSGGSLSLDRFAVAVIREE